MSTLFYSAGRLFANKLIRIRFGLIRRGCSGNPAADSAARQLKIQLDYYPYATDLKMANFFIQYEEQLLELIPGGNSGCGPKLRAEYDALLKQAKEIASPGA